MSPNFEELIYKTDFVLPQMISTIVKLKLLCFFPVELLLIMSTADIRQTVYVAVQKVMAN